MKSLAFIPLALSAIVALGLAPRDDKKLDGDLAKLQGKWKATVGPQKNIPIVVEIKDKKLTVLVSVPDQAEVTLEGQIAVDAKKSPKEIDWIKFTGPDGNDIPDNKGIYEINGDEWKVCNGGPGNDRPKEFKEEGEQQQVVVFTRVKDKDKDK
ncbi:MAG: hypothetical protein NVSMB14_15590 [Isosphaeraceae bacterium]